MVRKTNKSPLNQGFGGSIMGSLANQAQVPTTNPNTFNGSLMGMPVGATQLASTGASNQLGTGSMYRGGFFANLNTNNSQQNTNTGGFFGNLNTSPASAAMKALKKKQAAIITPEQKQLNYDYGVNGSGGAVPEGAPTNPNGLRETLTAAKAAKKAQQMNPKATGNNATVKNVFGQEQVPGSYDRSMTPLAQTQEINPILPPSTESQPIPPPAQVQQAITPTYDLSNQ
jgi:hypothetical protein